MPGKFIDRILDSMKLNDDDDEFDDDYDDFDDIDPEPAQTQKRGGKTDHDEESEEDQDEKVSSLKNRRSQPTVVSSHPSRTLEVCMIRPKSVEEGREICETLLSGRAVVINLEGINMDVAQRIVDFTSGACYAINGNLQNISSYIFIVTPVNVELSGDFQDIVGGNLDMSSFNINI